MAVTYLNKTTEPWRVGVLFSRSGYMALIEDTVVQAKLAPLPDPSSLTTDVYVN